MLIRNKLNGFSATGQRLVEVSSGGGGGGGGQPQTTTAYQTNLPEYAKPYVMNMLGAAQNQLFTTREVPGTYNPDTGTTSPGTTEITGFRPYQPYSTDPTKYFAGPSSLQQQTYQEAAGMQTPGQFAPATGLAGASGMGQLGTAQQARGLGQQGVGIGQMGMAAAAPAFGAGQQFMRGVTDPSQVGAFMSPYQQAVTDVQKAAAVREAQMASNAANLASARQGTYGGARQALQQSERERNLLSNLANIQAQGSQSAYDRALAQMQFGSNLGLQGIQTGLQGIQQGLAGTAQGLQGVGAQQAGYAGAGQAASTLGQLGGAQQQADIARMGLQQQLGQQQQQYQQNIINQAVQDYATQQQYPLMQLSAMSSLLRGLPLQSATTQTYQAAPSMTSQLAGLGTAAVGAYGMGRQAGIFKAGGEVKAYKYGGAIPMEKLQSMANDLSKEQLEAQLRDPSLTDVERQIFASELKERMRSPSMGIAALPAGNMDDLGMAGGGIVAFSGKEGSYVDPLAYLSGLDSEGLARDEERRQRDLRTYKEMYGFDKQPAKALAAAPVKDNKPDSANAPPASPPSPASDREDKGLGAVAKGKYDDLIEEGLKGMREQSPTAGKAQADLEKLRSGIEESSKRDPYMALIQAGLRMAGGKSQYALQNIAEGAEAGLGAYAKSKEAERADKKLLIAQQSALEQAEYARKTGNLNALIQAQTRLDAVRAQRENLGAQKEMAILSAREKARGDMIQRLMYQNGMTEDDATAIANRAYPSTIGTATQASQNRPALTQEQQKLLNKYK